MVKPKCWEAGILGLGLLIPIPMPGLNIVIIRHQWCVRVILTDPVKMILLEIGHRLFLVCGSNTLKTDCGNRHPSKSRQILPAEKPNKPKSIGNWEFCNYERASMMNTAGKK
jgi:hypothetical protein